MTDTANSKSTNTNPAGKISVISDVPYRPEAGSFGLLDVYSGKNDRGTIINLHGGGWFKGHKEQDQELAQAYCEAGFLVFVPNYRLAPAAPFPAQLEDVLAAIAWVKASDYAFDRGRLAVTGSSAGGNLAVEAGIRTGLPIVSWSGLIDLDNFLARSKAVVPHKTETAPDAPSTQIDQSGRNDGFYKWTILNLLNGDQSKVASASPIHRIGHGTGPMFLANSLNEFIPADEILRVQAALTAFGIPATAMTIPGSAHAKGYQKQVWRATLAFLDQYIGAPAAGVKTAPPHA